MKKGLKYTMAAAAGAGAVMLLSKKTKENEHKQKEISKKREDERKDYRNTERGKYEKNSKGIYYSNGNYEAFARPEKPEGVFLQYEKYTAPPYALYGGAAILLFLFRAEGGVQDQNAQHDEENDDEDRAPTLSHELEGFFPRSRTSGDLCGRGEKLKQHDTNLLSGSDRPDS